MCFSFQAQEAVDKKPAFCDAIPSNRGGGIYAPYPKHVPFTDTSAITNIAVIPAVQPAIGY